MFSVLRQLNDDECPFWKISGSLKKRGKKIGLSSFYFEMSHARDFSPVHNFFSIWAILKVSKVITFIFEGFLNLYF